MEEDESTDKKNTLIDYWLNEIFDCKRVNIFFTCMFWVSHLIEMVLLSTHNIM